MLGTRCGDRQGVRFEDSAPYSELGFRWTCDEGPAMFLNTFTLGPTRKRADPDFLYCSRTVQVRSTDGIFGTHTVACGVRRPDDERWRALAERPGPLKLMLRLVTRAAPDHRIPVSEQAGRDQTRSLVAQLVSHQRPRAALAARHAAPGADPDLPAG
jgi:hypothetical protein